MASSIRNVLISEDVKSFKLLRLISTSLYMLNLQIAWLHYIKNVQLWKLEFKKPTFKWTYSEINKTNKFSSADRRSSFFSQGLSGMKNTFQ